MRRVLLVVLAAVAVSVLVGAATAVVDAQGDPNPVPVTPPRCYLVAHDLNGDGRVNELDMNRWKDLLFKSGGACELGAPAGDCPDGMDINQDGIITFDDLNIMLERYKVCIMSPWSKG